MADNPMNRPSPGAGSPKKAGLTKPERINQRRSLPPPPPSAVQAAKQKSLPPPPPASSPASSVDVDIDLDDDATVVRDKADFSGFFDPDEDAAAPAPAKALGSSPWALPPVEPRPELSTLADTAVISLDPSSPVNPIVAAPSSPNNGSSPNNEMVSPALRAEPAPFAMATESERTEEVHEVEEVTTAEKSRPGLDAPQTAPQADVPSKSGEDDLDALFGRSAATRDALPAPALGSNSRGPAPPPPPSLRPPPAPSPPTRSSSPLAAPPPPSKSQTPVPFADASAPAAILPNPALPNLGVSPALPSSALPSSALPSSALPSPALPSSVLPVLANPGELPLAKLPPPPLPSSLPPVPLPPPLSGTSSRPPPLPPPPAGANAGLSFNDDDVTQIFDRASSDSHPPAAAAGLPPLPLPSFAPPPTATRSSVPFPALPSPSTFPAPSTDVPIYKRKSVLAVAAAALLVGVLAFFLWPSKGRLVVAVAGPNGTVVDGIKVSLGGNVVCQNSPCEVNDLEAKSYLVTVEAEGFERTAPQAVVVRSGEDTVHNVQLQAPVVTAPTGLDLPASSAGLTLYVDGKAMGSLPQKILDITPGEHLLRISGGERYVDEEKTVNVVEGQVLSLQPFSLKVKKGRATIEAGDNAEGAVVKLDGTVIKLPHSADLSADKKHTISATLEGFEDFEQEITFEDGKAEATFSVKFKPLAEDAEASEEEVADNKGATGNSAGGSRKSSGGKGTLNINSVPSAMVILDGRPIGKTPKLNIKVSAGAHSIVFVSSKGRKRATAKVPAGGTKTVSVKL
jgi:hypothetical protein